MEDRKKTICYIIDDEPKAILLFERLLNIVAPEWEIVSFNSPKMLVQQAKIQEPDVLFSDIEMPDMSGFKLLEELKKISVYPATVFVTGFGHYAIKAIREAVIDYLVKPVDIDELKGTVERVKARLETPHFATRIDSLDELTPTEKEVLKILVKGTTSAAAAEMLNSSPHTINTHRNHILNKMGCCSILEVVNKLQERG